MAKIIFKGYFQKNIIPALVFANDDVSNGTTTTNFKVQINWGDSSTPSVYTHSDSSTSQGLLYQSDNIYLIKCSSNTPTAYSTTSASTKTITIEGGWGSGDYDDASRKLAFPKQITTRFADNLFLNYKKDITLTTEALSSSYSLAFKFERDYVGLYSCDRLKLVAGKTYTIDSGDTQFTILSDNATFEDGQLVVGSDLGEVDYSFVKDDTTYYSRFEIVTSIDETSAPSDSKLEKMMTSRHHVESDAYDDITYNSTSVGISNKNIFYEIAIGNNFTLHGIGDFAGYYKPKKIKKISGATRPSVPNVTSHMFAGCNRLETSSFIGDSSGGLSLNNVTDMTGFASGMENYNGFWRLGLPGNNLTNLTGTFEYSNYTTSKIKNFPWSQNNITTIESLFEGTPFNDNVIQSIDVSSIENFKNLFKNNSEFNQYIGAWDTTSALTFEGMFNGAKSYNKYMRKLNTNSVTSMKAMFKNASSFDQDVYSFKTNAVESMEDMFNGASSFNRWINTNTGGANFNTDSVKSMRGMFKNATSFNRKVNGFDTSNVEDMGEMFSGAIIFNRVVSSFNTTKVNSMDYMFEGAVSFTKNVNTHSGSTKWNTSAVQTMRGMFKDATKFNSEIFNFDTTNVTDMAKMFNGATKFAQKIPTSSSKWNTSSVTDMSEMFEGASAFNRYIASWDTSSVTKMKGMFKDSSFNKSIKNWTVTSVETMESMFEDNDAFNQKINDWQVNSVGSFKNMFKGATAFDQSLWGWSDNIGSVASEVSLEGMFQSTEDSVPAFNRNISGWNVSKVTSIKNMFKDNTTFSSKIFAGYKLSGYKLSDMTGFLDGADSILSSDDSEVMSAISSFGKTTPDADGLHFLFGDDDDGVDNNFKSQNYITKRDEYETSLSSGSGPSGPTGETTSKIELTLTSDRVGQYNSIYYNITIETSDDYVEMTATLVDENGDEVSTDNHTNVELNQLRTQDWCNYPDGGEYVGSGPNEISPNSGYGGSISTMKVGGYDYNDIPTNYIKWVITGDITKFSLTQLSSSGTSNAICKVKVIGCPEYDLTGLDGYGLANAQIHSTTDLLELDLSEYTGSPTTCKELCSYNVSLEKINVTDVDFSSCTDFRGMFEYASQDSLGASREYVGFDGMDFSGLPSKSGGKWGRSDEGNPLTYMFYNICEDFRNSICYDSTTSLYTQAANKFSEKPNGFTNEGTNFKDSSSCMPSGWSEDEV